MDSRLIHKIAVLCKDHYVARTIDDLFMFAGAERSMWKEPSQESGSVRMDAVYGWFEGIEEVAPDRLDQIGLSVAAQIADNENLSPGDRNFLKEFLGLDQRRPRTEHDFPKIPNDIEKLLEVLINGIPRAIVPFRHSRKGSTKLEFDDEYSIQTLLHSLLSPWIGDIRPEEYTPSHAGSSTRVDFLLTRYNIVIEVKFVRDLQHAKRIGDELLLDIAHYSAHPRCTQLWNVVYDPKGLIPNPVGLRNDLDGKYSKGTRDMLVRTFILPS